MLNQIIQWHRRLIQPHSNKPELARKEHIFYILLIGSLYLVSAAAILVSWSFYIHYLNHQDFHGASPGLVISIIFSLLSLYQISKQGQPRLAAQIYLVTLWLITIYTSLRWGALLYQAVLMYALIIVFAGILISTRISFIITIITSSVIMALTYFQAHELIYTDQLWRQSPPHLGNAIIVSFTLVVIALFSWLSNQEISRALNQAQKSEQALKKERDSLEIKVQQRTQQLKQVQLEKMMQWKRFVNIGKIASGLFHDIRNYLTSVTLDIELDKNKRALSTMRQIQTFVQNTQKQLGDENHYQWFSPSTEIKELLGLLDYSAKKHQVELILKQPSTQQIYGPISIFHQIIINLLNNAIDACDRQDPKINTDHQIVINIITTKTKLIIKIKDSGSGINPQLQAKIFEPFFTTKHKSNNSGLGLFLTKAAIEQHFSGTINLTSKLGVGTTFTISLPQQSHSS